jgi:regulatory protein
MADGTDSPDQTESHELKQAALRLLATREHSRVELCRKLQSRAGDKNLLERVLDQLEGEHALSDQRFAREYVESRKRRGFGPISIRRALREKGVDRELITNCMAEGEHDWDELLRQVVRSKFGAQPPTDYRDWAKQARFLEYRGFAPEQIRSLLAGFSFS